MFDTLSSPGSALELLKVVIFILREQLRMAFDTPLHDTQDFGVATYLG